MTLILIILTSLVIFTILIMFSFLYYKQKYGKKIMNRNEISQYLRDNLDSRYKIYNQYCFKAEGHEFMIDHLVLSKFGLFMISAYDFKGKIRGLEKEDYITYKYKGKKYDIVNPIRNSKNNIIRLNYVLHLQGRHKEDSVVKSVISFNETTNHDIKLFNHQDKKRPFFAYHEDLPKLIKQFQVEVFNPNEIDIIDELIKTRSLDL